MNELKPGEHKVNRRQFLKRSIHTSAAVAALSMGPMGLSGCDQAASYPYDIIIKNGSIFDGVLNIPVQTDIGIKGDKIIAMGDIQGPAGRVINAKGLAVMPGFIDVHTHCDLTFIKTGWKRHLSRFMPSWKGNYNYLSQGVTTVVTGNCGWGYGNIDEWYKITKGLEFGTNVYHLVPHGVLREELFGKNQPRELSRAQMSLFKKRVEEELDKGAIGLSTGLEYAPGFLAPTKELIELSKIAAKYNGIYATHIRNESAATDPETGQVFASQSIAEAVAVGREADLPVEISHLKIAAPINGYSAALVLDPIEKARQEGIRITADQYPYDAGSTIISFLLPKSFRSSVGVKEEFKTKEGRAEIIKEINKVFEYMGPDKTLVTMCAENEGFEGKTLQEIGDLENKSPAQAYADLVSADHSPMGVFFAQDMDVVKEVMTREYILTGSDGWTVPKDMTKPHPRTYGTFPRKLGRFFRDQRIVDLAMAIRSMTDLPARTFGMKGRGRLETGYFADIALIDLNKIMDNATYLDPHHYSSGITHLIVNGVVSIENGEFTGNRGGQSLRA